MFDQDVAEMYITKEYAEKHRDAFIRDFKDHLVGKEDPLFRELKAKIENGEINGEIYSDGSIRVLG